MSYLFIKNKEAEPLKYCCQVEPSNESKRVNPPLPLVRGGGNTLADGANNYQLTPQHLISQMLNAIAQFRRLLKL